MRLLAALAGAVLPFPLAVIATAASIQPDFYNETLNLIELADAKILARFDFSTRASFESIHGYQQQDNMEVRPSHLVHRSMSALVRSHGLAEMHLSLASGRWQYDRWGSPPFEASPPGAELWAYFSGNDSETTWTGLINSLAGLFCASLNQLDSTRISTPVKAYQSRHFNQRNYYMKHGLLPLEHPCTENLTPFAALLPCRRFAGLAQLLNPHQLFDANWQKIGVHVAQDPSDDSYLITLEVEIVADPMRMERERGGKGRRDWSLDGLFGRKVDRICPAANASKLHLRIDEAARHLLTLKPPVEEWLKDDSDVDTFSIDVLNSSLPLKVTTEWRKEAYYTYPHTFAPASLSIDRISLGYGQERGALGVVIENHSERAMPVIYSEALPWWIKLYIHTLAIPNSTAIQSFHYQPAQDRKTVTTIEAQLLLPPKSSTRLTFDYDKGYLRYTEYPSDAHRGFALPPAVLTYQITNGAWQRAYSNPTLVMAPLPDFSMPYNVVVLSCTVLALSFGTIFNMLQRQFVAVDLKVAGMAKPS